MNREGNQDLQQIFNKMKVSLSEIEISFTIQRDKSATASASACPRNGKRYQNIFMFTICWTLHAHFKTYYRFVRCVPWRENRFYCEGIKPI